MDYDRFEILLQSIKCMLSIPFFFGAVHAHRRANSVVDYFSNLDSLHDFDATSVIPSDLARLISSNYVDFYYFYCN